MPMLPLVSNSRPTCISGAVSISSPRAKKLDRLLLAFLDDLEVVRREVGDVVAAPIGDGDAEVDEIDFRAERRLLCRDEPRGRDRQERKHAGTPHHRVILHWLVAGAQSVVWVVRTGRQAVSRGAADTTVRPSECLAAAWLAMAGGHRPSNLHAALSRAGVVQGRFPGPACQFSQLRSMYFDVTGRIIRVSGLCRRAHPGTAARRREAALVST